MHGAGLTLPGWGARFAATRTGFPGLLVGADQYGASILWSDWYGFLPEASAVLDGALEASAFGGFQPMGYAVVALEGDATAVGARQPLAAAALDLRWAASAVGWRAPDGGAAVLGLTVVPLPAGRRPPLGLSIDFDGDLPLTVLGSALSGWHRPLSGEAANLTVTAVPGDLEPGWLEAPPLGHACQVYHDGRPLMTGFLAGVRASPDGIELRIEG